MDLRSAPMTIALVFLIYQFLYAFFAIVIEIFRRRESISLTRIATRYQSLKAKLHELLNIIKESDTYNELKPYLLSCFSSFRQLATRFWPYITQQAVDLHGGYTTMALMLARVFATYCVVVLESWPYTYSQDCGRLPRWYFGGGFFCLTDALTFSSVRSFG